MGYWPTLAPLGYLNQKRVDKKGLLLVDSQRAPVIKEMFEKVAHEKWSGRKLYHWLKFEKNFYTRGNKPLSLSGIYRVLNSTFYYGMYEYPRESGNWYKGKHKPLITQELYEKAQEQLARVETIRKTKEFAFTKLMVCGLCGSGVTGEEKFKNLKDGTVARYIYYGCTRGKDRHCKNTYIREKALIKELLKIIDKVKIDQLGMRFKLEEEVKRYNAFQMSVLGDEKKRNVEPKKIDVRTYAKYLLKNGSIVEKRELLAFLQSKIIYEHRKVRLLEE